MTEHTPFAKLAELLAGEAGEGDAPPLAPWRFAGMGLLIAWLCCTHLPGMSMYAPGSVDAARAVDYALRVGDVGTFLAVGALAGRIGALSVHRKACLLAVLLSSVCTLLVPWTALSFGAGPLLVALAVCAGVGGAVLFLLWAEAYACLGPSRCIVFGSTACLLAGAVALAVSRMDLAGSTVAVALLPAACGLLASTSLSWARREPLAQGRPDDAPKGPTRYPIPWKIVVLMATAGFASGFAGSLLVDADGVGAVHRICATALFGALLLGGFLLRGGEVDTRVLAWGTLPVALASFIAIPLAGAVTGGAVSFLVKFSYVSFTLFTLMLLANIAWRYDIPTLRMFAFARAASEGAMLAGILIRRWLRASGALDDGATLWLITIIGLVAVVGCVVLWFSERSVTSDWGAMGVDPKSGRHVPSRGELVRRRCEALAQEHGLTPREREVLELVADGLNAGQVEQALFLSHNTLKTHLRHIYAKLGVHTREEAAALANPQEGEVPPRRPS